MRKARVGSATWRNCRPLGVDVAVVSGHPMGSTCTKSIPVWRCPGTCGGSCPGERTQRSRLNVWAAHRSWSECPNSHWPRYVMPCHSHSISHLVVTPSALVTLSITLRANPFIGLAMIRTGSACGWDVIENALSHVALIGRRLESNDGAADDTRRTPPSGTVDRHSHPRPTPKPYRLADVLAGGGLQYEDAIEWRDISG